MAKEVVMLTYIEWPAGTNRSSEFAGFSVEIDREKVASDVFPSGYKSVTPGVYTNTCKAKLRPTADNVFLKILLQELDAGTDIAILTRKNSAAKSATNPEITFSIAACFSPPLGGDFGALVEKDLDLHINSAVTWDDGTTPIVLP